MITCDEIIHAAVRVSANVRCTAHMNPANIASTILNDEKVRYKMDCYILHTVLLVTILLFIMTMQNIGQNRKHWPTKNTKIENNELKKDSIQNRTCYYFDDIVKFGDFDLDTISLFC